MSMQSDVNFSAPVKSVSIENMVRMRQAVMDRFSEAIRLLEEAERMAAAAHIGSPNLEIATHGRGRTGTAITSPDAFGVIRREIDRVAWSYLMDESGLRTFMDAEARKKWTEQLCDSGELPELTAENVRATFQTMHAARGEMFERGVIGCFRRLSWDYRTNNPYRFGKRIILRSLVSVSPWRCNRTGARGLMVHAGYERTNELDDLLRVFHVLDGKPEQDHRQGCYRMLSDAIDRREWRAVTEYFSLVWFKNGNGHLTFKRLDLVERLNGIIAKHFPGALAHERSRAA